ncbi:hypothetical protein V7S43_013826, partial [Phytophthora oleae]
MGRFDLPAMLNYARETSKQDTVALVGHSEGTTQAFVAFSEDQTLAQNVSFAALAPIAWLPKALECLQDEALQEVIEAACCN